MGAWLLPDMKKKKAVRNNMDDRFGRGLGGVSSRSGGSCGGGGSGCRGERGVVGASCGWDMVRAAERYGPAVK